MSGFIEWLENVSAENSRVRATLRRSLAFGPGAYPDAFPYIEPHLKQEDDSWRRVAHYLVSGLWALHWREGRDRGVSLGRACALHQKRTNSNSTERRFIALLDSDQDQLPHRLRQMVALLKEQDLDFESLLRGVLNWNHPDKWVQNQWARDFYQNLEMEDEPETKKEEVTP